MAEDQNSRELPVVDQPVGVPSDYAEHAKLMMDLLALAYQTDLTRVSTFMLATRGQRPRLSGDRRLRLASSAVAPSGRGRPSSNGCTRSTSTTSGSSRYLVEEARDDARRRRHDAGPHAVPLRHRHQRQQHPFPRRPADRARRRQGGRHQGRPLHPVPARARRWRTCTSRFSRSSVFPIEKFGDSTGKLATSERCLSAAPPFAPLWLDPPF